MMTGLYVHVPFCETKCGYCDFYSVPLQGRATSPLVRAMVTELDLRLPEAEAIGTIFAGGGTPTLLPMPDLKALFGRLGQVAYNHDVREFTCEANPATVDDDKIRVLTACGVDRMSFGAQSFDPAELRVLERLHSPDDVAPAVAIARRGGIRRINLDLIFGIPGQTEDSWRRSLESALRLEPEHLSCYGLTYEPNTPLYARLQQDQVTPCDNALEADLYLMTIDVLAGHGYKQYEISNFARPGEECLHNLIYWSNGPYLGVGPSAASYHDGVRCKNVAHIETYIQDVASGRPAWRDPERLDPLARAGETAMLQLRLNRGIDVQAFREQVGLDPLEIFAEPLAVHSQAGHLTIEGECIRLTRSGRLLADRVIGDLLDPSGATIRRT